MREKVHETIENHCKNCLIKKEIKAKFGIGEMDKYCHEVCPVGLSLINIGHQLTIGRRIRKGVKLTQEVYEHLSKEMNDREIAKKFGIAEGTLGNRKRAWGLTFKAKLRSFSPEDYYDLKELGMYDKEIAKMWGISVQSMGRWKRKHIPQEPTIMERLLETKTKVDYYRDIGELKTEKAVAEKWGCSESTLKRWRYKVGIRYWETKS